MARANGAGSAVDLAEEMAAFDALPRALRDRLNGAKLPWSALSVRGLIRNRMTAGSVALTLMHTDRRRSAQQQAKLYGKGNPPK
jgi:hypothetical protein